MNQHPLTKETGFLRLKFETKAQEGLFEGYGAVFGNIDQGGDIVMPGAFAASLKQHEARGTLPAMLWMHKQDAPIGRWLAMAEDSMGLHVKGQLNLSTAAGREAYAHIKDGDVSGLSIGYAIPEGGSEFLKSGVQRIKQASLFEVSVVTLPMNEEARIKINSKRELEDLLVKKLLLPKEAAKRLAHGGYPALNPDNQHNEDTLAAIVREVRNSTNRYKGSF